MDSPTACASCAVPTADESNHSTSAAGMTHPHHSDSATALSLLAATLLRCVIFPEITVTF